MNNKGKIINVSPTPIITKGNYNPPSIEDIPLFKCKNLLLDLIKEIENLSYRNNSVAVGKIIHTIQMPSKSNRINDFLRKFLDNHIKFIDSWLEGDEEKLVFIFRIEMNDVVKIRIRKIKDFINSHFDEVFLFYLNNNAQVFKSRYNSDVYNEIIINTKDYLRDFSKDDFKTLIFNLKNSYDKIVDHHILTNDINPTSKYIVKDSNNSIESISGDMLIENEKEYVLFEEEIEFDESIKNMPELFSDEEEFDLSKINVNSNGIKIGVIDSGFPNISKYSKHIKSGLASNNPKGNFHGESTATLASFGNILNPKLDDGLGIFEVVYFEMFDNNYIGSKKLIDTLEEILKKYHKDIRVYSLSFNVISKQVFNNKQSNLFSIRLDELQKKYNVRFVISGGNDADNSYYEYLEGNKDFKEIKRILVPADSNYSIIVNSVNSNNMPASYSMKGDRRYKNIKPTLAYYGGDDNDELNVLKELKETTGNGTSFATPLVARKLAWLINHFEGDVLQAETTLINSTIVIDESKEESIFIGNGILPIHIDDIVQPKKDKVFLSYKGLIDSRYQKLIKLPIKPINNKYDYKIFITVASEANVLIDRGVEEIDRSTAITIGRSKGDLPKMNDSTEFLREEELNKQLGKWKRVHRYTIDKLPISTYKHPITKEKTSFNDWEINITRDFRNWVDEDERGVRFAIAISIESNDPNINIFDNFYSDLLLNNWNPILISIDNYLDIDMDSEIDLID